MEDCNLCMAQIGGSRGFSLNESLFDKLNESRKKAVGACLRRMECENSSAVELIWGPPGTGKTITTVTFLYTVL